MQWDCSIKKTNNRNVGEGEALGIARNANWCSHFEIRRLKLSREDYRGPSSGTLEWQGMYILLYWHFHVPINCCSVYNSQETESPCMYMTDKEYVAHTWNGILFRWEEKWDLNFIGEWTQMEYIVLRPPRIREEQHSFSLICEFSFQIFNTVSLLIL